MRCTMIAMDSQPQSIASSTRPRVLIIGCGFGGLAATRALAGAEVDITLVGSKELPGRTEAAASEDGAPS